MKRELALSILKNLVEYGKNRNGDYSLRVLNSSEYKDGFHRFVVTALCQSCLKNILMQFKKISKL